ncbi:transcription factor bHLH36-like [Salvia divinorum]|uniref:Transcription factor bHLH36-like n=1 Tax=Salvia divinorum TaxID=28513 RepID=A0ABD1FIJ1_SALDI
MSCFSDEPSLVLEQVQDVLDSPQLVTKSSKKRRRASKSNEENKESDDKMKKSMHREIERQRRQEMSTLYASLRELLPLEYIKGKRSVSDHMHEAANYIKDMEMKIEELQSRRDELKNASPSNSFDLPNYVTVNCCYDGVEILMNCGIKEGYGFALSRVIMELIQSELDVVACISNKVNGRFLYKIQAQVNALVYIDLAELQMRLANEIN